jgi:hypothetical protein
MRGAGGGRPPKPPEERRHRNPPTKDTIVVYSDDRVESVPEPVLPFTGARRELWDQMWAQPIAVLWDVVDVAALTRMVLMQTSAETVKDSRLLIELRQLEDRFLLNPYARAQQRVVIEDAGREQAEKANRPVAGVSSLERARRAREA